MAAIRSSSSAAPTRATAIRHRQERFTGISGSASPTRRSVDTEVAGVAPCAAPLSIRLLAGKDDPRLHGDAPVQILDIVVDEPDASGSDEMADGLGRIGAVNE